MRQPERSASSTRRAPSTPTNPFSVGRPPRRAMRNSLSQRLSRLVRSVGSPAARALRAAFPGVAITVEGNKFSVADAISRTWYLFLKRYADAVGVYRTELFRAPGLGLQWAVGMHFASALLVFGIQGFDAFYGEAHHGLVADLARQFFVAHAGYVQVGVAAVDSYVGRRRGVAKGFLEAADLGPPIEGLRRVSGRKNGDRAFYDRVHGRSIIELIPIAYNCQVRIVGQLPVTALIRWDEKAGLHGMRYAPNNRRARSTRERRPAVKKISTVAMRGNEIFR